MLIEDSNLFLVDLVDRADVVGVDFGVVEDCGARVFRKYADTQVTIVKVE